MTSFQPSGFGRGEQVRVEPVDLASSRRRSGSTRRSPSRSSARRSRSRWPSRTTPGRPISTAAVLRGVTVSPKPSPNSAERQPDRRDRDLRRPARTSGRAPPRDRTSPTSVTTPQRQGPDREAADERPDGRRRRQGAEREPLVVRAAVEDAVDEHRPADDRGREGEAGEQRDERGGAEGHAPEQPRIEERVGPAEAADDREDDADDARSPPGRSADEDRVQARRGPTRRSASPRRAPPPARRSRSRRRRRRSPTWRRGVSQPLEAAQAISRAMIPIGTLT